MIVTVLAITAIALLPRLWFWRLPHGIDRDGVWYASLAESLVAGRGYTDITGGLQELYPPGFPAAIAVLIPLTGDGESAGKLVSLIAGTLTPAVVYLIGRRLFTPWIGLVAALLTAFHPRLVYLSTAVLSDALYACLLVCVLLAAVPVLRAPRPLPMLGLGVLTAVLALVRPEGYLVAAALVVASVVALAGAGLRGAAVVVVAFVSGAGALIVPYAAWLFASSGYVLTGKWRDILAPVPVTGGAVPPSLSSTLLRRVATNVFTFEAELATELSVVWIALVVIGAVLLRGAVRPPEATFVALVVALTTLAILQPRVLRPRYISQLYPLLFLVGALALERLRASGRRRLVAAALVVVALHLVPGLAYPLRHSPWNEPQLPEQVIAGRWIRDTLGPGRRIMSLIPNVAYYASGRWTQLSEAPPDAIAARAASAGVDLLVVDEEMVRRAAPALAGLLDGAPPAPWRLVRDFAPHPGRRVRVMSPR
jgi:hypothetical protein